jgi:hypothetical protein
MKSTLTLPEVLSVGFTGHRTLRDEARCRRSIADVLAELKSSHELLCGVASVAAGGDLLFCESCLATDIPLRVLLPLPAQEFRNDFDAGTWERAELVIDRALSVEVVAHGGLREEHYYECGLETVQQSQLVIALWDGEPARGFGGTAQIVSFAQSVGRQIIYVNSNTGVIQFSGKQNTADMELAFLNKLPDPTDRVDDGSPTTFANAWLDKLDANAMRVAPQVKRLAAVPIILTAAAVVVTGAAQRSRVADILGAIGIALGVLASLVALFLRLDTRRAHWIRIRTAAEVTRSILALWTTPSRYQIIGAGILPELAAMVQSLNLLKSRAVGARIPDVHFFKDHYLQTRILDQKEYFLRQSQKAARTARTYGTFGKFCIGIAVLSLAWRFLSKWLFGEGSLPAGGSWLTLMASAIFQMATIAGALIVVHDCNRREKRYEELYRALSVWEAELQALQTWRPVMNVVDEVERALLVEVLEWRALFQNMRLPKN